MCSRDLMSTCDQTVTVLLEKLTNDVAAERERNTAVVLTPTSDVLQHSHHTSSAQFSFSTCSAHIFVWALEIFTAEGKKNWNNK